MARWIGYIGFASDKLNIAGGALSGISILVAALIVTYEVIVRYIFQAPTTWVLEVSIYLCLASVFLAGGYALRDHAHIDVDVVVRKLPIEDQKLIRIMGFLLVLVYCLVFTWKGLELTITSIVHKEVSPTLLNTPMVIPHSLIPIGGIMLVIELIRQILNDILNFRDRDESTRIGRRGGRYISSILFAILVGGSFCLFSSQALTPWGLTILVFVLIFGGLPIAFALGLMGLMGFYLTFGGGGMLNQVPMVVYKTLDDFIMVSIPLFIMLSAILSVGKISTDLYDFASTWVRHLPGGLGVATILACAVFAAMCGSSVATVATIGLIAIPEMLSRGYKRKLVFGTVAIGGVLGPLIPPSIFMILIGTITGDSVGKLFMAGMLPGIMLAGIFCIYIIVQAIRSRDSVKIPPASWKERRSALKKASWGIMAPVIILGGIYSGAFTPTEAAGVGATYSLFICAFIYRSISFKKLWEIVFEGGKLASSLLFIVTSAMVFGQLVTLLKIPERLAAYLAALPFSPMTILFLMLIGILVLGALMDEASILLITYPILYHIFVQKFGFDSIWFALVFVFTLEVGLVAPPVGINIFVVQGIWKDAKFEEVVRGVLPFALLMVAAILLVVFIRPLSLWLPSLIG